MATKWLKSMHCRSNAIDDVHTTLADMPSKSLFSLSGCRCSTSTCTTANPPSKTHHHPLPAAHAKHRHHNGKQPLIIAKQQPPLLLPRPATAALLPTLTELPRGHSSRRVVELIFSSSWSAFSYPFPGDVEALFKVRNPPRACSRFEEQRATVRSRAGPEDARCAADGNEMMMFHVGCGEPVYDAGVALWSAGGGGGVRVFEGSGEAHRRGGGGGEGRRRAVMVCRVIAGRVGVGSGSQGDCDSVWVGRGELLVLDPQAVLPCFLIIYSF